LVKNIWQTDNKSPQWLVDTARTNVIWMTDIWLKWKVYQWQVSLYIESIKFLLTKLYFAERSLCILCRPKVCQPNYIYLAGRHFVKTAIYWLTNLILYIKLTKKSVDLIVFSCQASVYIFSTKCLLAKLNLADKHLVKQ